MTRFSVANGQPLTKKVCPAWLDSKLVVVVVVVFSIYEAGEVAWSQGSIPHWPAASCHAADERAAGSR